jgi:hypothetical protein
MFCSFCAHNFAKVSNADHSIFVSCKGKVKFHGGALQHYSRISLLYSDPKGVPSFTSRGAAHQAA